MIARSRVDLQKVAEEYATKWTAEKRRDAIKTGDAMADGKFPIRDQEDLNNAVRLAGSSTTAKASVIAHIKAMAKKHSLTLPPSLR